MAALLWVIGLAVLAMVALWLSAAAAVGDLRPWRLRDHPDAPPASVAALSEAYGAAGWHRRGVPAGPPPLQAFTQYAPGEPIVVTRVVQYGTGYGWVCAEDQRSWITIQGERNQPFVFEDVDSALIDLRYHCEHGCSALVNMSGPPAGSFIPARLLYRYEPEAYEVSPETCPHVNGTVKLPGEGFDRCAHCGTPGRG